MRFQIPSIQVKAEVDPIRRGRLDEALKKIDEEVAAVVAARKDEVGSRLRGMGTSS